MNDKDIKEMLNILNQNPQAPSLFDDLTMGGKYPSPNMEDYPWYPAFCNGINDPESYKKAIDEWEKLSNEERLNMMEDYKKNKPDLRGILLANALRVGMQMSDYEEKDNE